MNSQRLGTVKSKNTQKSLSVAIYIVPSHMSLFIKLVNLAIIYWCGVVWCGVVWCGVVCVCLCVCVCVCGGGEGGGMKYFF